MKKLLLSILFLFSTVLCFAQDWPKDPIPGFAIPIGSKFSIKLLPVDSVNFYFYVEDFGEFEETINWQETDTLFAETEERGIIEGIFCFSTHGDTEEERKENMQVVLIMQNRTDFILEYGSDMMVDPDSGEFEETSNVGIYPNAKAIEMWPHMIYQLGLHSFKQHQIESEE